jgi:hypothetical protein
MDSFEPSAFGPLGGIITLAVLFVLRELTSGVLKEVGKDVWGWAKRRRSVRPAKGLSPRCHGACPPRRGKRQGGRSIARTDDRQPAGGVSPHPPVACHAGPGRGSARAEPPRGERQPRRYAIAFPGVARDLDAFWRNALAALGMGYRAPSLETLEGPTATACGPAGPGHLAFYCPAEEAVYVSPAWLNDRGQRIGDFAPVVVLAHEWGHHVQTLLGAAPGPGTASELQADCLAGAYAADAGRRGLLDPGDVTEAVALAAAVGDPLGLPQDAPGAHGSNDDRITAFMRGYLGGVPACVLPGTADADA